MSGFDSRPDTHEHIAQVRGLLLGVAHELIRRAHAHDRSKLAEPELAIFNEYTPKLRDTTYGSQEYKDYLDVMGEALSHHYAHNDHHPEHFGQGVDEMDLIQMVEMLCDWLAATRRHADGDIDTSITKNRDRFGYDAGIERLLRNTVPRLAGLELAPPPTHPPNPRRPHE